jgi:glutamine synthetase
MLATVLGGLKARGWTAWVGIEPEFFVFDKQLTGGLKPADPTDVQAKPSYD